MSKLTYSIVKSYIESFDGHILLSEEYEKAHSKLKIQCPQKHIFEMSYSNFKRGYRCSSCFGNKKLTIENIKKYIESFGYKLLSNVYVNVKYKLKFQCDKGHIYETSYNNFQQGKRCSICANNQKLTINYIRENIESFGYKLLSNNYKNAITKLKIQCSIGHSFEMSYNCFQKGQRCPVCLATQTVSKEEKEIFGYVKSIYSGIVIENDRTQIINPLTGRYLELDIWLPELNKAIEYNGIYWHSKKYQKTKDKIKLKQCQEKDIELLMINDKEWKSNKDYKTINNFILRN
jgi:hypothetical protein